MTVFSASSFRDPEGRIIILDNCALRIIFPEAKVFISSLLTSPQIRNLIQNGAIVATESCDTKTDIYRTVTGGKLLARWEPFTVKQ